jgi:hypothetical protein
MVKVTQHVHDAGGSLGENIPYPFTGGAGTGGAGWEKTVSALRNGISGLLLVHRN